LAQPLFLFLPRSVELESAAPRAYQSRMPERRRPPDKHRSSSQSKSRPPRREPSGEPAQSESAEIDALVGSLSNVGDPSALTTKLAEYLAEIRQWNVQGNLVSQSDLRRLVSRHVSESLAALPWIDRSSASQVIDIGSGGGFPIVPLKLARPQLRVALVESRRMKSLFLRRLGARLELQSYWVWSMRIETLAELPASDAGGTLEEVANAALEDVPSMRPSVDLVTARAVAPLSDLASWSSKLVGPGGRLLAFKGSRLEGELTDWVKSPGPWMLEELTPVTPEITIVVLRRE